MYIQAAYLLENKETIEREFWVFKWIKDNWTKYIVSSDKKAWWFVDWIEYKNLIDFILEL